MIGSNPLNDQQRVCQQAMASVAARHLDTLSISERIFVCEGIASVYPEQSTEHQQAKKYASDLRAIETQQMEFISLFKSH